MNRGVLQPKLGLPTLTVATRTEPITFCELAFGDYERAIQACLPPPEDISTSLQSIKDDMLQISYNLWLVARALRPLKLTVLNLFRQVGTLDPARVMDLGELCHFAIKLVEVKNVTTIKYFDVKKSYSNIPTGQLDPLVRRIDEYQQEACHQIDMLLHEGPWETVSNMAEFSRSLDFPNILSDLAPYVREDTHDKLVESFLTNLASHQKSHAAMVDWFRNNFTPAGGATGWYASHFAMGGSNHGNRHASPPPARGGNSNVPGPAPAPA